MVVPLKQFLYAWSLELCLMSKHCLRIRIFPLTICVFGIKVIFLLRWDEGCWHSLFLKGLPVESLEPAMLLDHVRSIFAETIRWLTLD